MGLFEKIGKFDDCAFNPPEADLTRPNLYSRFLRLITGLRKKGSKILRRSWSLSTVEATDKI